MDGQTPAAESPVEPAATAAPNPPAEVSTVSPIPIVEAAAPIPEITQIPPEQAASSEPASSVPAAAVPAAVAPEKVRGLETLPDPLLALALEIRAVQAQRAAALVAAPAPVPEPPAERTLSIRSVPVTKAPPVPPELETIEQPVPAAVEPVQEVVSAASEKVASPAAETANILQLAEVPAATEAVVQEAASAPPDEVVPVAVEAAGILPLPEDKPAAIEAVVQEDAPETPKEVPPPFTESAGIQQLAEAIGTSEATPEIIRALSPAVAADIAPEIAAGPLPALVAETADAAEKQGIDRFLALTGATTATALLAPPEIVPEISRAEPAQEAPVPDPVAVAAPPVPLRASGPVEITPEPAAEPFPLPAAAALSAAPPNSLPVAASETARPLLALAPLQKYSAAASRAMQPAMPRAQILTPDSGPRITLPGPTLPPQLTSFQDARVVTIIGDAPPAKRQNEGKRQNEIPPAPQGRAMGWFVSLLVMVLLLGAGLAVVFYFRPQSIADAQSSPTAAVESTTASDISNPLSKFIEVTGFRIVVDVNKKSEIQYLVVNHSSADLSAVNISVTLRAASAKAGQGPVCHFTFSAPSLKAFEAKEMASQIEKPVRPLSLPDWHDLRADVQVTP